MTTYYSVLEVTPTTDEWVADYIGPANKLVAQYGGKYVARTNSHERLEGQGEDPALRIIIEWPSRQSAIDFMNDPEYVPHLKARTEGSVSHHYLIEGKDDLAS
ncbi:Mll1854 protein [Vibrio astriarenae]|nr:Mll1854 protein [Vibrio sp. C7]